MRRSIRLHRKKKKQTHKVKGRDFAFFLGGTTMNIIKLNAQNCQNCFKCIRECPLKAIEFKNAKTEIIEDACVLCGTCMETCPRGAKYVRHNAPLVKELIKSGKPVYVSLAPSYTGFFGTSDFQKMSAALKKLGFAGVEETAIGAAKVSHEYEKLMQSGQMNNIIATACSSVVMLIEQHFPQLLPMLAPVSSPMMAHARLMREAYGDIYVVFIGPCLSKMHEAEDPLAGGMVDIVLNYRDINKWFAEEGITIEADDPDAHGVCEPVMRIYPKQEGIIKTIREFSGYTPVAVDGIDRCMEFFQSMSEDKMEHIFVEANICAGGCIGGPIMRKERKSLIRSTMMLSDKPAAVDQTPAESAKLEAPLPRVFANREVKLKMPTEEEMRSILARFGKMTPEDELNCGSCGYATCREKAIAVYNGKADVTMCLPFLREQAENKSSMIIAHSPNGIVAFDADMNVTELNPKAEELFGVDRAEIIGQMIPALYGETAFDEARDYKRTIVKKIEGANEKIRLELSMVYLPQNDMFIAFAKDISDEEANKDQLNNLRMSTVNVAQNVIEKQMRVAQEIASLLGETTAETKVALTRLKRSIEDIEEISE